MNKTIMLVLPIIFLISCSDSNKKTDSIKVSGEGKIRVKPDLVIMTIDVSFVQPRMADAVRLSQQTVDSVVDICQSLATNKMTLKQVAFLQTRNTIMKGTARYSLGIKQNRVLTLF